MHVALVHDSRPRRGGAERMLAALPTLYPKTIVFTSAADLAALPAGYRS